MTLDKNSGVPLYRQLADTMLADIASGKLTPGSRLPAIRTLAGQLAVNNTTLVATYKHLEQLGAVYSVRGSGVYVAHPQHEHSGTAPAGDYINFADASVNPALFPSEQVRAAFEGVITKEGSAAFSAPPPQGYLPLREEICEMLAPAGIKSEANDVHIVQGMRAGISAVADAILQPGDTILVEQPAAQGITAIFASRGVRIIPSPIVKTLNDLGKIQDLLTKHKPRLIYIQPTFQVPTGESYPDAVKARLILMASATNTHIIEADDCSDFYYRLRTTPVKAYDNTSQPIVSYVGSFDRTLAPGMAGYVVTPVQLNAPAASGITQRGLAAFIASGSYAAHLSFLRASYTLLYKRMAAAVQEHIAPHASCSIPEGGLGMWIKTKRNATALCDEMLARGALVSPGALYDSPKGFRISFAGVREDKVAPGLAIIGQVLSE
jgi:DNA-binding transcriptional MocR family regulator